MTRTAITTDRIAAPVGPFSPAMRAGELFFLSGQVAQDPATGKLIDRDPSGQTEQILTNITALVEAAGRSLDDVVRVGIFLTDMAEYAAVNRLYERWFTHPYPARTVIGVAHLPPGADVEIDAIVS